MSDIASKSRQLLVVRMVKILEGWIRSRLNTSSNQVPDCLRRGGEEHGFAERSRSSPSLDHLLSLPGRLLRVVSCEIIEEPKREYKDGVLSSSAPRPGGGNPSFPLTAEVCRLFCLLARAAISSGITTSSGWSQERQGSISINIWPLCYISIMLTVCLCIPYKISRVGNSQSGDVLDRVEVLMISSPDRHDFVFPKGGWEIDETASEAACREALEEAGVRGTLNETALGVWEFRSKSRQNTCSLEGTCKGYMFALEVTEELNCYPEMDMRARKWVTVREAYELCRYNWMREALDSFRNLMTGKPISSVPELSESSAFRIGEVTAANYAIVPI
ncbi:hypothetical protein ZIOFF_028878 [Zingiber officinale]|uniref:Nudix hydrolase domain-containing protein n=1 Tax=Zingiber officinale TaxID=94328 RepID=A0A8J5L9N0_ZINOF|nr:hypothetical protein ZIOFF_028878 [Zingiber officinale]